MLASVLFGANDLERAQKFYDAVGKVLGLTERTPHPNGGWLYAAKGGFPELGIVRPFDKQQASAGNGTMAAFRVQDPATIDSFHAIALENGGRCEGEPRYRGPAYGAYVRDPQGNKLCAFCLPEPGAPQG